MNKILFTLVWDCSSVINDSFKISVDPEIRALSENMNLTRKICVDSCGCEFTKDSYSQVGWQLKSKNSFLFESDEVIIGFVKVSDDLYDFYTKDREEIIVNDQLYHDIADQLIPIGFDVCDSSFVSASLHGVSYFEEMNKFGLYSTSSSATRVATENTKYLSEHGVWNVVELFLTNKSFRKLTN